MRTRFLPRVEILETREVPATLDPSKTLVFIAADGDGSTVSDARTKALASAFTTNLAVPTAQVNAPLLDAAVTPESVTNGLTTFLRSFQATISQSTSTYTLVLYIGGEGRHGAGFFFSAAKAETLTFASLLQTIDTNFKGNVILCADSCFSGGMNAEVIKEAQAGKLRDRYAVLSSIEANTTAYSKWNFCDSVTMAFSGAAAADIFFTGNIDVNAMAVFTEYRIAALAMGKTEFTVSNGFTRA